MLFRIVASDKSQVVRRYSDQVKQKMQAFGAVRAEKFSWKGDCNLRFMRQERRRDRKFGITRIDSANATGKKEPIVTKRSLVTQIWKRTR